MYAVLHIHKYAIFLSVIFFGGKNGKFINSIHWEFVPSQSYSKMSHDCSKFNPYTSSYFDSFKIKVSLTQKNWVRLT